MLLSKPKSLLLILAILVSILVIGDTVVNWNKLNPDSDFSGEQNYYKLPKKVNYDNMSDSVGSPKNISGIESKLTSAQLPLGGRFTNLGSGSWHLIRGTSNLIGKGEGRIFNFAIEIENNIDTSTYGGDEAFEKMVIATLSNPKGWINNSNIGFRRVNPEIIEPDFYISLTSPQTLREPCQYSLKLETSCFAPQDGKVLLNESRWVRGALTFNGDIGSYRQYAINHEVGHAIGFIKHDYCQGEGDLAPVMMQQTLSLDNAELYLVDPSNQQKNDYKCVPNAWPFPNI